MNEIDQLRSRCRNVLPGHGGAGSIAARLRSIADGLDQEELGDIYGSGDYLVEFELDLATQFGKSAGVFMPSGTMAQQIALRLWCDRSGRKGVAMHPTAHLETAEYLGYQLLHGLHRIQFGAPETIANRLLTAADLQSIPEKPGAILVEVPCRPLGGELPPWQALVDISEWARDAAIPIHLDGARIWQCRDAYNRTFAEIGALFDSIYVSFYKDLGGLGGCMLLGPEDFVAESRIWQRRHGGNLFTQSPYVASARQGLADCLPQLPGWNRRAPEIAAIINGIPGMKTRPHIPQVNFFQVHMEAEAEALLTAHSRLANDSGTFVFGTFRNGPLPGWSMTEVHCWANSAAFDLEALQPFLEAMMRAANEPIHASPEIVSF